MKTCTIYELFRGTVEKHGARRAYGWKEGKKDYVYLTYTETWDRVQALRRGLADMGIGVGSRVALLSENRVEWALTDLATQSLGAVTVAIYPTLPAEQVEYLLRDSGSAVLVVSDAKQLAKGLEAKPRVETLKTIVSIAPSLEDADLSFAELERRGRESKLTVEELDARIASQTPDDLATLIYTSGTTGDPKGAMLSHTNLLHTSWAAQQISKLNETEVFLSFLPLCHIVERVGGHYLPIRLGACVVYSQGVFGIGAEFGAIQPTVFLCVPRLFEGMQEKVVESLNKMPGAQGKIARWALATGMKHAEVTGAGKSASPFLSLSYALAKKLALVKILTKATGGRLHFLVSGGAPLNPATFNLFRAIGLEILEGYGLTECPVISLNRPGDSRIKTVGQALPEIEIKIAEDGEILARGPARMSGYYMQPEATAESIDSEGWFHTGDVGELTKDGRLRITDRKKDILVLTNGKKVAPQPIEERLKQSPLIAEVVLLGDKQPTVSALVVPSFEGLRKWAAENNISGEDRELIDRQEVRKLYREEIDRSSGALADFERIRKFALLDHTFTIESGELTPTLKVKRKVVAERYGGLVEGGAAAGAGV